MNPIISIADLPPVLTTGLVARLLCCSPRTVVEFCDSGGLPFYRLPTGAGQGESRRIPQASLLAFLRKNGVALPHVAGLSRAEVLLVGVESQLRNSLLAMPEVSRGLVGFTVTDCPIRAGYALANAAYLSCVIVDTYGIGLAAALSILSVVAETPRHSVTLTIFVSGEDQSETAPADVIYRRPFDGADLIETVRKLACGEKIARRKKQPKSQVTRGQWATRRAKR